MPETKRNHYYKVRKEGGAKVLALTPFLPSDWKMVKIEKEDYQDKLTEQWVRIRIERVR